VRRGGIIALLEKTDAADFERNDKLETLAPRRYRVRASFFFHGAFLWKGDELAVEEIGPAETLGAARLLAASLRKTKNMTVALFDLDERNIARYENGDLERVFDRFTH
jgi:hypothetical protein